MVREWNRKHVYRILKKYGMSVCEYSVLDIVRLRIPASPTGIAKYAKDYDKKAYGNPFGIHSLDDYLQAVESCFKKGLLIVLTVEDFSQGSFFWAESHKPGSVDFSEKGYRFYKR